jgi:hypothetical protein
MNPKILKKVQPKIKAALQIIDRYTDFDIVLRFGRSEAMEKAKDGTVTTVSIGVGNALAHGKADFESKRILAAYKLSSRCGAKENGQGLSTHNQKAKRKWQSQRTSKLTRMLMLAFLQLIPLQPYQQLQARFKIKARLIFWHL